MKCSWNKREKALYGTTVLAIYSTPSVRVCREVYHSALLYTNCCCLLLLLY